MFKIFFIFLLLLNSCSSNKNGLMLTDKDGKTKIIQKQRPDFNKIQLTNQKLKLSSGLETEPVNKHILKNDDVNLTSLKDDKNKIVIPENPIKDEFVSQSSAYFNKSVVDRTVFDNQKDLNLTSTAPEIIDKNKNILDFNFLPQNLFSDDLSGQNKILQKAPLKKDLEKNTLVVKKEEEINHEEKREENYQNSKTILDNKYYLQLGSFTNLKNAESLVKKFKNSFIVKKKIKGKNHFRVVSGGYKNNSTAELEKEKIIKKGHFDVYVFIEKSKNK